jgi:ketosteroid isomerase-like protein
MGARIVSAAALAVLFAAAPASADPVADIRAADQAWSAAFGKRDIEAAVTAVDPAGAVLAPNAPTATGPDAVRALFTGFFAIPDVKIGWTPDRIDVAQSGELGYSSGRYSMDFTGPGGKPVHDSGKYVTVWKKQPDGSWKVLLDAFNTDLAPLQ